MHTVTCIDFEKEFLIDMPFDVTVQSKDLQEYYHHHKADYYNQTNDNFTEYKSIIDQLNKMQEFEHISENTIVYTYINKSVYNNLCTRYKAIVTKQRRLLSSFLKFINNLRHS